MSPTRDGDLAAISGWATPGPVISVLGSLHEPATRSLLRSEPEIEVNSTTRPGAEVRFGADSEVSAIAVAIQLEPLSVDTDTPLFVSYPTVTWGLPTIVNDD